MKIGFTEDQTIEFEEILSNRFQKKVVGMTNTTGGNIYLGIRDDCEIVGIKIDSKLKESIQDSCNKCISPIHAVFEEKDYGGKQVLIVKISKGRIRPHLASNGVPYFRRGPLTNVATPEEIAEMVNSCGIVRFEKQPVNDSNYDDIDKNKIKEYLRNIFSFRNKPIPTTPLQDVLVNLDCAINKDGEIVPTAVGLLFFGKNPQKFIPHCRVNIARYKGTVPVDFIDKDELIGTIPEIIENAEIFIKRNTRKIPKIVGFERVDITEYPYEALREALVNSLAHREYYNDKSPIHISIFDDRIEVINPGVPPIELEHIEGKHIPRNEIICQRLKDLRQFEGFGTGISRMRKSMKSHGLKEPLFKIDNSHFKVTFFGPKENIIKLVKPIRVNLKKEGLNDRQIKALARIYDKGVISHKEYCMLFGVTNFIAMKDFGELVTKKFLKQYGKGAESYYKVE